MLGSAVSGSMGFNAQFANVISAIFLATGQDPAHIVEGSLGITTVSERKSGLYFSVYLPDLMVGVGLVFIPGMMSGQILAGT